MKKYLLLILPILLFSSESRIDEFSFYSEALGVNKNFNILLPANYDSTIQHYPVVYLFRGHENEWADEWEDNSRNGRNIKNVYDELYEAGLIDEIIFVMPGVSSSDNSIPGLGVNFKEVSLANNADGIGTGQFEDCISGDLIQHIDSTFRTINTPWFRAIDGFSLGGYTTMNLITHHPELFISAGSYDGTLMWLDFDDLRNSGENDDNTWLMTGMFDPIFGRPRDVEYMKKYNAANLVYYGSETYIDSLKNIQFLVHSGAFEQGSNRVETQHFVDILAEKGIYNVFEDIRLTEDAIHNWHFADLHVTRTIPYHFQKFQEAENSLDLHFVKDFTGNEYSGVVKMQWDFPEEIDTFFTIINYKNNSGHRWQRLAEFTNNEKSFQWNSEDFRDGVNYQIQIIVYADLYFARIESEKFTVNNPGNAVPEIELVKPAESDTVSGYFEIQWDNGDADGDELEYELLLSFDGSWRSLVENLQNVDAFSWNTNESPNSPNCRLLLKASDGSIVATDTSDIFSIFNERKKILLDSIEHISGNGSGKIYVVYIDESQLYGHAYEISFAEGIEKTYSVRDRASDEFLIDNHSIPSENVEGEMFNGLRLMIHDYKVAEVDLENTGWEVGQTELKYYVNLPTVDLGSEVIHGYPYPADYRIEFFDHVVDTSNSEFGTLPIAMPFSVENVTENRPAEIIFIDNDADGFLTRNDVIYVLEKDDSDEWMLCWMLTFSGNPADTPPQSGDIFHIKTLKPFTNADIFEFSTKQVGVKKDQEEFAKQINLYAYPNPFNPTTNISFNLQKSTDVKIFVYDIKGRLIKNLSREKMIVGYNKINWDSTDELGQKVASGIYFYQLKIGEKVITKKMTLVR